MEDIIEHVYDRDKFLAHNPAKLGESYGWTFYEHPFHGDEYPIIADNGKICGLTDFYDMDSIRSYLDDFNNDQE